MLYVFFRLPIIVIKIRRPKITVANDIRTNSSVDPFSSFASEEVELLVMLYIKVSFRYVEFKRSMKNSGRLSIDTKPIMSEKSEKQR